MAEKYRLNWSRDPVRRILANVPTYMMWDDHDIKDGWGSMASDSPTMAALHPRGAEIFRKSTAFFEDARDVYWHFPGMPQSEPLRRSLDPALPELHRRADPARSAPRDAVRLPLRPPVVLVLDSRGERDVFRKDYPILGAQQWTFIDEVLTRLPEDVDALAVVTPTPVASQDPDGQTQRLMGARTDDIEAFSRGDEEELFHPRSTTDVGDLAKAIVSARIARATGRQPNLGDFKISAIDEARDQWSHRSSRPEQQALLKKAFAARFANRTAAAGRGLVFLSGDIHIGCTFDVTCARPRGEAVSLTSSGISQIDANQPLVGTFIDEEFTLAPGIRSTLRTVVNVFNFGVVQVQPTGSGAQISATLAHEGDAVVFGLTLEGIV